MSEYYVGGVGLSTGNFMMKAEYMIVKSAHHKGGVPSSPTQPCHDGCRIGGTKRTWFCAGPSSL